MAFCLLSRGMRSPAFLKPVTSLQLAKALISLGSASRWLQLRSATSQPTRQKFHSHEPLPRRSLVDFHHFIGHIRWLIDKRIDAQPFTTASTLSQLRFAFRSVVSRFGLPLHRITEFNSFVVASQFIAHSQCELSDIRHQQLPYTRRYQLSDIRSSVLPAAAPATRFPSTHASRSSLKSYAATKAVAADLPNSPTQSLPPCLVCDIRSSGSCPVCDENFCGVHLYLCSDCNNQFCGNCFNDHYAEGHWSDSDTAGELSRVQHSSCKHAVCQRRTMSLSGSKHSRGPSFLPALASRFIAPLFSGMQAANRHLFSTPRRHLCSTAGRYLLSTPGHLLQRTLPLEVSL